MESQFSTHRMHSHGIRAFTISLPPMWRKTVHHHLHIQKKAGIFRATRLTRSPVAVQPLVESQRKHVCVAEDDTTVFVCLPTSSSRSRKEILIDYSTMTMKCSKNSLFREGRSVHGHIVRRYVDPDLHLYNCIIHMYTKCGRVSNACKVFETMPQRDVVSWNALLSGFVGECRGEEANALFREMITGGFRMNEFVLATGLKACALSLDMSLGEVLHAHALRRGFLSDVVVGCALVDLYTKCGAMKCAESIFWSMSCHNSVTWNALLAGYVQIGDAERVLDLFNQLTVNEIKLSKFILSSVLKGCACLGRIREGQAIHGLVIKIGLELNSFLQSCLLDLYAKCSFVEYAYKIFVRISVHDVVSWTAMISCFAQHGFGHEAFETFCEMRKTDIVPNQFTLASLVSVVADIEDIRCAASVHGYIIKVGLDLDNTVGNALVMMYMKFNAVQDGCIVFNMMEQHDTVSWNALLSGFCNDNYGVEGLNIFMKMLVNNVKPNKFSFISVLRSCTNLMHINYGEQVHAHVLKNGLGDDCFVATVLVDLYAKCGFLINACRVFDRMSGRDAFTWTVIITGFAHMDEGEKAVKCFQQMQREGVRANQFTFASCLRACSSISALENGCQFHSWLIKNGHANDIYVASALLDMYGKCGSLKEADALFHNLEFKDTVAWNTIICCYSQHGLGKKALETFKCMLQEGLKPDEVTFVGVLSACSHVGLIEEGRQHFESMSRVYGINPTMQHCACMVDMLGRAGRLDEVESFIDRMSVTPNSLIWQAVLGSCRMHGNIEFGEKAAHKLFELDPLMDSTYILLSNIYAAACRWDDVSRVRQMMTDRGVKKEPGCSWIEADGRVHVFVPYDSSHVQAKEIHRKLHELHKQLALSGYVPDTSVVLHDVADSEKKESLFYHSERLALAYGLISTNKTKTIRIFKNLRICRDCHTAIKLISTLTERDIIIRDASRFHHFKAGSCSCYDYW